MNARGRGPERNREAINGNAQKGSQSEIQSRKEICGKEIVARRS